MALNLLYSVQVLPCWFGASEDQPCLCEVPPKTNFHETINSFLCISTFCVLFHMSDAIYFKRSPIDKASFDVKMTESIHFSTWFNHLPGLLYFCCLCACVSVKGCVSVQDCACGSVTWIFSFSSGLPWYCELCSWVGAGAGGGRRRGVHSNGLPRDSTSISRDTWTTYIPAVVKTHTSSDIPFQIY